MAAIIQTSPRPTSALPFRPSRSERPDLRVLQGGRRPATSAERVRRRLLAAIAVVLVAVTVAVGAVAVGRGALASVVPDPPTSATPARADTSAASVVVRPGDTFWSIARRVQPSGDIRPLVDRLVARHGDHVLHPGERLVVG